MKFVIAQQTNLNLKCYILSISPLDLKVKEESSKSNIYISCHKIYDQPK